MRGGPFYPREIEAESCRTCLKGQGGYSIVFSKIRSPERKLRPGSLSLISKPTIMAPQRHSNGRVGAKLPPIDSRMLKERVRTLEALRLLGW